MAKVTSPCSAKISTPWSPLPCVTSTLEKPFFLNMLSVFSITSLSVFPTFIPSLLEPEGYQNILGIKTKAPEPGDEN